MSSSNSAVLPLTPFNLKPCLDKKTEKSQRFSLIIWLGFELCKNYPKIFSDDICVTWFRLLVRFIWGNLPVSINPNWNVMTEFFSCKFVENTESTNIFFLHQQYLLRQSLWNEIKWRWIFQVALVYKMKNY